MGNPIPAPNPNPMGVEMRKKYPQLLNGNGDEKALPGGEQTRWHPYSMGISEDLDGRIGRKRKIEKNS